MNKIMLALGALTLPLAALASTWTLQSKTYNVDTLFNAKIGPGTTQTSLALSGGSTLRVFYTTVDLTNPYIEVRVAQGNDKLVGLAKLSAVSDRKTKVSEGIEYIAGVNADFFGNSQPIGSTVVDGEPYYALDNNWVSWYMNDAGVPGIETLAFGGTATAGEKSHKISSINNGRYEDNLVIFTPRKGSTTGTNQWGTEVAVKVIEGTLGFNGTCKVQAQGAPVVNTGSMSIPAGGLVLSGNGTASTFLQTVKAGDVITLDLNTPLATGGTVSQMAGGQPMILKDGKVLDTQGALDHLTSLNPRTAVGYDKDRRKLVLLVVDGRAANSVGVVSKVLADIMREVGCSDAMNFDGGGSSELYTRAFGVRNHPSDGSERTVINSVWAVTKAPFDESIGQLAFTSPRISLPKYGFYVPTFYSYNKYGVMKSTDQQGVTLSCPPELGEIVADGSTLFVTGSGTHKLTAHYGDVTAEIMVTVGSAQPQMRLDSVLVDVHHPYKAEVHALVEDKPMTIDNKAMTWTSEDATVATVDEEGVITGHTAGKTTVTANVDAFTGSLPVTVHAPRGRYMDVDPDIDMANWTVSKTGLNVTATKSGTNGIALDYKVTSTRGTAVTLKRSIDMYAIPDSIRLVINPGDCKVTKVDFNAAPTGERAVKYTVTPALQPNVDNVVTAPVSAFCDPADFKSWPLTFTSVALGIGDAASVDRHLEIKAIQGVHTALQAGNAVHEVTNGKNDTLLETGIVTLGTTISINTGTATVYNLNGAVVAQVAGWLDTATIGRGVFVISDGTRSQKFVVK